LNSSQSVHSQLVRRGVTLVLRGGQTVHGNVHVGERQSLVVYMATRGFFLNLTEVRYASGKEVLPHLAIRTDLVLWAQTHDGELPLTSSQVPSFQPRWAEIVLDGGPTLHAGLNLAGDLRMTDCIDGRTGFLPAEGVRVAHTGEVLGDAAINMSFALTVREIPSP
jgi:hypothetical protein